MVIETQISPETQGKRRGGAYRFIVAGAGVLLLFALLIGWPMAAGTGSAFGAGSQAMQGAAAPLDCAAWQVVSSPSGNGDNVLSSVSAVSSTDVWAVGSYTDTTGLAHTLTEHWDGLSWSLVPTPQVGTGDNYLQAVAARATTDVWAVGQYRPTPGANLQTLILHWTGSAWTQVASPNGPSSVNNALLGVAATSATDAWAVGYYTTSLLPYRTLILRWNGTSWSTSTSPNPGLGGALSGVTALTVSNAWAVGAYADFTTNINTLVVRWTGSSWSQVTSPSSGPTSALAAIAAIGETDIWAVGIYSNTRYLTLTEHWNGGTWATVPSPSFGTGDNGLGGVTVRAPDDVWAVGGYSTAGGSSTLTLHWDGVAWTPAPSENPSASSNGLLSVTVAGADVWAVGSSGPTGAHQTLIERLGTVPCATATATSIPPSATATATVPPPTDTFAPTRTPGGATATPMPPSATPPPATATLVPRTRTPAASPTARPASATPTTTTCPPQPTATPCAISFSDVHPTDYFYEPVRYLACGGVISGYADGTFRPFNNTTRGQMVKIVILGFARPISTPAAGDFTFHDVPPSQPFFAFVETAASANIVSGYACGGAGEPCDDRSRPYFRPNANVTRGQLSKIDVGAAGWSLLDPPAPGTFADVAPGSAFYTFVETAASHGVVSGYSCGGLGEPCDQDMRPYFRQGNSATRGQIAKIVYLSIPTSGSPCIGERR